LRDELGERRVAIEVKVLGGSLIEFIAEEQINLLVFDVEREEIVQWIK
jgi:hypothetical protein